MYYAIRIDGKVFKSLDLQALRKVVKFSTDVIYNKPKQLSGTFTLQELSRWYEALQPGPLEEPFVSCADAAHRLHELAQHRAKLLKEADMNNPMKTEMGKAKVEVTPAKDIVIQKDSKITTLLDKPPCKEGTNRYRNMLVVMDSKNVAECLDRLRALKPSPGSKTDIILAVQLGAIKLG